MSESRSNASLRIETAALNSGKKLSLSVSVVSLTAKIRPSTVNTSPEVAQVAIDDSLIDGATSNGLNLSEAPKIHTPAPGWQAAAAPREFITRGTT